MPEATEADPTGPGTRRPKAQPLKTKGDHFELMKLPDFSTEITCHTMSLWRTLLPYSICIIL